MSNTISISMLCKDMSEVINRVRGYYGRIPLKPIADLPEIKAAEQVIECAARLVLSGRADLSVWRGALIVYESAWMKAFAKPAIEPEPATTEVSQ